MVQDAATALQNTSVRCTDPAG